MLSSLSLKSIFLLHMVSTFILFGISLFTQFAFYPVLQTVDNASFMDFHYTFILRYGVIMLLFMLIELITAINMTIRVGDFDLHSLLRSGLILVISIWIVTLMFEVPNQWVLQDGYNNNAVVTLSYVNIFRLICWGIRSYILIKMIPFFYNYEQLIREKEALR